MRPVKLTFLALSLTVLLTACGGGAATTEVPVVGNQTSPPVATPPPAPPPQTNPPPATPPPATPSSGTASLSWLPPTENEDGTALVNLAGYEIVYGNSPNTLNQRIVLNNAGLTRYVITSLSAGTYYFGMRTFNNAGSQSALSPLVSKTIS